MNCLILSELELNKKGNEMKFIATISDRTQNKENISKLLSYGIDTFRYVYRKNAYDCKILEEKISIPRNLDSRARILIDLPGYKGRTGLFGYSARSGRSFRFDPA